ncbi:MAG: nucleotidyltransferase family protein [Bacteroidota bacterium]
MRNIAGILLAAGRGARFGGHKLLSPLTDGTPLGVAAARHLLAALPDSLAVVRTDDEILSSRLSAAGMRVIVCEQADHGMGMSLSAGVAASRHAQGWVIALADMPFIEPDTIEGVVALLQDGAPLVAPSHDGQRGHPVGFGHAFRDELLALQGDHGARDLLTRHASRLVLLPVDDPGILMDVDTPADIGTA